MSILITPVMQTTVVYIGLSWNQSWTE